MYDSDDKDLYQNLFGVNIDTYFEEIHLQHPEIFQGNKNDYFIHLV